MSAAAKMARSPTVETWPLEEIPVGLLKWVCFMPKRLASSFICLTNSSIEPLPMASARVMAASLADWMVVPLIKELTLTGTLGSRNIREPSTFHAALETVSIWLASSVPFSNALKAR